MEASWQCSGTHPRAWDWWEGSAWDRGHKTGAAEHNGSWNERGSCDATACNSRMGSWGAEEEHQFEQEGSQEPQQGQEQDHDHERQQQ